MNPIHVLLVNDSLLLSRIIRKILASEPLFSPIGWAKDGLEAEDYVKRQLPDVILMDIHMPRQGGVETTRNILAAHAIPILVVTATISQNMNDIFQCMQYGALEAIKPPQDAAFKKIDTLPPEQLRRLADSFIHKIKTISHLKHKIRLSTKPLFRPQIKDPVPKISGRPESTAATHVTAIGASTGGPSALTQVLKAFDAGFPAAIVIVQHMDADFLPSLIVHLQQFSHLPVQAAVEGTVPRRGHVYLACKNGHHLKFGNNKQFAYDQQPESIHRPSVNVLFESVAEIFGPCTIGALLTGMGGDGARGLKIMRDRGGFTLAQDKESSVIYGMPKVAFELDACKEVVPLSGIGQRIVDYFARKGNATG